MRTIPHWINGKPVETGVEQLPVLDPATDTPIAQVWMADSVLVEAVVDAAEAAAESWAETSMSKRAHVLFRFRDLLLANRSELAALITSEHGKTLDDATGRSAEPSSRSSLPAADRPLRTDRPRCSRDRTSTLDR